jgi:ATP-dependent Clp protease ATP-binding subunit ClpC
MFERYTQEARRTIFSARYEASQLGSPVITTEHLLLGLLRESRELRGYLKVDMDELASRLRTPVAGEKISTSADLRLDGFSKRVLAHAAQEAKRLGHPHIGTEHLLLGIMREDKGGAAQVLRAMGARTVDTVRRWITDAPATPEGDPLPPPGPTLRFQR